MIGIIPAAGGASRMGGIPKALLPIPTGGTLLDTMIARIGRVTTDCVLGVSNALYPFVARHFVIPVQTETMTETVLACRKVVRHNESVLFGMPDTYFDDGDAFVKLVSGLAKADLVVGVFRTRREQRHKLGMVNLNGDRVTMIVDKPQETSLEWAWGVLAWKPIFWDYLNPTYPHVGYALQPAINAGLNVQAVRMDGGYWDAGTPEEYFALVQHLSVHSTVG